eukprot:m.163386 g.163386  ORF g.163386 m.163386 type:complete len:264 (-) comp14634_c0_seq3:97-888(-)
MGDAAKAARSSALGVKAKAAGASGAGKGKKSTVRDAEKKVVFKGYLQSGLEPQWPKIPSGPTQEIRAQLEALAAATRSPRRVRAGGKVRRGADAGPAAPESAMAVDEAAPTAGGAEGEATLRADLAVGVNEVTRGLEKGRVELVVVSRGPTTDLLTKHLLTLAHMNGAGVCALPEIAELLAKITGVRRACTVGFRKCSDGGSRSASAASLLEFIQARAVPTSIPWLPPNTSAKGKDSSTTAAYVGVTVKKVGFKSGARRKPKT